MSSIQLGKGKVNKNDFGGNTPALRLRETENNTRFKVNDMFYDIVSSKDGSQIRIIPMYIQRDLKYILALEFESDAKVKVGSKLSKSGLFQNKELVEDISRYVNEEKIIPVAHMEENERIGVHTDEGLTYFTTNELVNIVSEQLGVEIKSINSFRLDLSEQKVETKVDEEEMPEAETQVV